MGVSAPADGILVESIDPTIIGPAEDGSDRLPEPVLSRDAWTLFLDDLMPDEGREIVLTPPDDTSIELASNTPIADRGVADPHVTASGIDVEGFHFIRFESGTTLYYEGDLIVTPV